jgi:hypothetical protein
MPIPAFNDRPPESDKLTKYDERHLLTYLRLLDAAEEGADWREALAVIFDMDPEQDLPRARTIYDSHLARARWMTEQGYRHLLRPSST